MTIDEAKVQIRNAMTAYFTKDRFGRYRMPPERQRPIFLMGPPGIGKTAIMEQTAAELGVGFVSYSMTHHTRQSALGLPFITKRNYGGTEYDISEYTMSEIIASVYDAMEASGCREGILFLDEINCVSETLAPAMLQFLQYKTFGRHRVPEGWIVVTAGNPPEYNRSVREFDIATWDRLKRIDVEPDYEAWRSYARDIGVHAAVLTYLDVRKDDFYRIETTAEGRRFVTARGWTDLSDMLHLYELNGLAPDEKLMTQYLQHPKIARNFAIYYDLFQKYRSDYQIDRILSGAEDETILQRARDARFDERLTLMGLLLEAVASSARQVCLTEDALTDLRDRLRLLKTLPAAGNRAEAMAWLEQQEEALAKKSLSAARKEDAEAALQREAELLDGLKAAVEQCGAEEGAAVFGALQSAYAGLVEKLRTMAAETGGKMSHLFRFCEKAFSAGQELLIAVTELTANSHTARFIGRYGCEEYYAHNRDLLFNQRQREILSEMTDLGL